MNWTVEPFHVWWDAMLAPPEPLPPEPPSAWEVEKGLNRLAKRVSQIKSGRWVPTVAYRLTGAYTRDLRQADIFLVGKGGDVRQDAKR